MTTCRTCKLSHTDWDARPSDPRWGSPIIAAIDAHGVRAELAARIALGDTPPGPRTRSAALHAALVACGMGDMDAVWSPRRVLDAVAAWGAGHAAEIFNGDIAEYIAVREDLDVQAVAAELDARWRDPAAPSPGAWKSDWERWPGGVRIVAGQTWPKDRAAPGPFFDADIDVARVTGTALTLTFGRGTLLSSAATPATVAELLHAYGVTVDTLWEAAARGESMRERRASQSVPSR